jgi:uncharacterized protein (UPF0335 family)
MEQVKRTKTELIEAMKRLYMEIQSITEQVDEVKAEAKERGMPHTLMAKVASLLAKAKADSTLEKNAELEALLEEVRSS